MSAVDFFTVPTATFHILFVFVVPAHDRRRILHFNVTEHPTAAWTGQQFREAFPWNTASRFLLRDRDGIYGDNFARVVSSMGIEHVLRGHFAYYHRSRTHLSLAKDAPEPREIEPPERGEIVEIPEVSGLHHRYLRRAA